jgi:type VII secretion EsaA-like protein
MRRSKLVRLLSVPVLLAALVAGFLLLNDDAAHRVGNFRPTVGLVNEDLAAEFNNDEYAFGASFIDRISKDSEYNWTVVSRPVAEKAYKDGSVDAVLYIPRSFTHDILTLQETSPTKATVEFRLRHQPDDSADRLLESRIRGIVHDFNQSVVTMYYASLADNIAQADGQMSATLGIQKALITALTSDVQEPFSATMPTFQSLIATATGLKDVDAATAEAYSSYAKSIMDMLTGNSEALTGKLPSIEAYAERQRDIAQINVDNSNQGIADQAESDHGFYGTQFDSFRTGMLCKLNGLDLADAPEPCVDAGGAVPPHFQSRIAELRQAIAQFSDGHALSLTGIVDSLEQRITNLRVIEYLLNPSAAPITPRVPGDEAPPAPPGRAVPSVPAVPLDPAVPTHPVHPVILQFLHDEIEALEALRDSLDPSSAPAPLFEPELTNLDHWYADTLNAVQDASLASSTANSLEVQDWSTYTPDAPGVFVDTSDQLTDDITASITQSADTSSRLTSSSTTVPDNSSQFEALLQNSTSTSTGAERVFTGVNKLLSGGNAGLTENEAYYANFATVLANTRTPGVDTGNIYAFFSAPIDATNVTAERPTASSDADPVGMVDAKWAMVFAGGLLAGVVVMMIGNAVRGRKKA